MNNYVIFTDSACDIKNDTLKEWEVSSLPLTFRFVNDNIEHNNDDMETSVFYQRMKDGDVAKTAAINTQTFYDAFRAILESGRDLLYIGFSSGLSTTFNSARLAIEQLKEEFPGRKIFALDSLCASAGEGLLVYLAVEKKKQGATIEETYEYAKNTLPKLCHWFTVDDLVYLKRGGRVSGVTALVGNLLGIKPVLHVDDEGHLVNVEKVRGRRAAIAALADKYTELVDEGFADGAVFISHAECKTDAELLASMIKTKHNVETKIITDVGTVIGAHSGPGTLALFFIGKNR